MVRSTRALRCGNGGGDRRVCRARVVGVAVVALVALVSTATVSSVAAAQETAGQDEVRIVARLLANEKVEFGLQQRQADDSWGDRRLPRVRFFPADASVGRWLSSSPITVRIAAADAAARDVEVRIVARLLANGKIEFGLQQRQADDSWGDRQLPRVRFFPTGARVGRWLSSSPLTVKADTETVDTPEPEPPSDEPSTASEPDETTVPEPPAESDSADVEENRAPTPTYAIDSQDVAIGETMRLHAGPYFADPDGDPLRYEAVSADESVVAASVSGGTVTITGVGAGAATVTVTAHDPSGLSVEQSFDVTARNVVVSVEVSGATTLTSIGETSNLSLTATMTDGSRRTVEDALVRWGSSDVMVATVSAGTLTAVGGGIATVTAGYEQQTADVTVSVRIAVEGPRTVRVVYAVPSDREFRADHSEAIQRTMLDVQSWYRRQLSGLSFSLYSGAPEQCRLSEPADFYARYSWQRIVEGLQHCAPVTEGHSDFVWVIFPDVVHECGPYELGFDQLGRGGHGLTILSRWDLDAMVGEAWEYYYCSGDHLDGPHDEPFGRWAGGVAHELGHAFSVPHPPGCDEGLPTCDIRALLQNGYEIYPDTYLRFDDKETLLRSAFIDGAPLSAREATAGRRAVVRGTVVDPDGAPVEGVRLSLSVEPFWSWTQTDTDGTFEITLPEDASGSATVSVHAGHAADCRWLGYHAPGGLTAARDAATMLPVSTDGATEIRIELPARPDELCGAPRSLRGTVVESDGTPARGLGLTAFDNYAAIEPDGTFEMPLPESGAYPSILSIYDEDLGCGLLGYNGAGGFTTRREDAARFEVGAALGPGIELTLPANRQDLCDAQELLTGTVQWPNGEPAEGTWLYAEKFGAWAVAGPDGAFELRLPRASPPSRLSVFAGEADGSCWVGYHRPDGLTPHWDQASQAETGTAVHITLPAGEDELCNP